jgi:predicted Rossmann fold nucleotide-binding protein DprA/Smf involved in DNA uptake
MKVIIAGSRSITDVDAVCKAIQKAFITSWAASVITEVVCGMAPGVDTIGKSWAEAWAIPVKEFPADWDKYGKAAGPIRNRQMAEYADAAIVIWDGKSSGSKNMITTMNKLGKPVHAVLV